MLNNNKKTNNAIELLEEILKIPGKKILTLHCVNSSFSVDIDESSKFGHQPGLKELFLAKLHRAFSEGGAIIIREFLPIRVKRTDGNGKIIWLPEKNLYGILLKDNKWIGCNREQLKEVYEIDALSGSPLSQEEGVHYQDFGIYSKS
jgi:hypothetical protein